MRTILVAFFVLVIVAAVLDHISTSYCIPLMGKSNGMVYEGNQNIVHLNMGDWALIDFTIVALLIGILSLGDYLVNQIYPKANGVIPILLALVIYRMGWAVNNFLIYLTFN